MSNNEYDGYDKHRAREALDGSSDAGEPFAGYEPHPLFPREDNSVELRDIQFVSFRRRSSDGAIDNLAEDIPAGEVLTWADVVGPWGGGQYKAIGKDKNHRIVAWYPEKRGEWVLFDLESKPFTLRAARYRPAPPHPLEATLAELLRELRATRTSAPSANDMVLVEVIKWQGELLRTVLTPPPVDPSSPPKNDPMATALQILTAFQKLAPQPQAPPSIHERLAEYKTLRDLTTPTALPPPDFDEIKKLFMAVMQADALSESTAFGLDRPVPAAPPSATAPTPVVRKAG